jgi:hypothetical protein
MELKIAKQLRVKKLLEELKTTEMNRKQMAEFLGMSQKAICHYVTELKFYKQIYISRYETNTTGSFIVYYMTGNKPNAVRPKAKTYKDYNEAAKLKRSLEIKKLKPKKFIPRPDVAAAWLFN